MSAAGVGGASLIFDSVISESGVDRLARGSGEVDVFGVGNGGGISEVPSGVMETRLFRLARTFLILLRFGGDTFLEGDGASEDVLFSVGLKIWEGSTVEGSTDSLALVLRLLAVRGVAGTSVVFLRGALLVRVGAGVNSSPLSSSICPVSFPSSSSSESMIALRRAVARRDGLTGDSADIAVS